MLIIAWQILHVVGNYLSPLCFLKSVQVYEETWMWTIKLSANLMGHALSISLIKRCIWCWNHLLAWLGPSSFLILYGWGRQTAAWICFPGPLMQAETHHSLPISIILKLQLPPSQLIWWNTMFQLQNSIISMDRFPQPSQSKAYYKHGMLTIPYTMVYNQVISPY